MRVFYAFTRLSILVLVAGIGLAGCKSDFVHFTDSIDLEFNFAPLPLLPFDNPDDHLHIPYVQGAEFRVTAHRDHSGMSLLDAVPESLDPTVVRVLDGSVQNTDEWVSFRCRAEGPGSTSFVIYRDGFREKEWGSAEVEVGTADSARLFFSGPVLLNWPFEDAEVLDRVNVLKGGTATFLVWLFGQNARLYGNGTVRVLVAEGNADVEWDQTYFFEDRDWFRVTPLDDGDSRVKILADGINVAEIQVHGVTEEEVDTVLVEAESEKHASTGDILAVLAVGYTSEGEPIYGIEYDWYADGWKEPGDGDIYKYVFHRDGYMEVEAEYGDHSDTAYIHAEDGWVTSSNRLGCTTVNASAPSVPPFFLLLLAGVPLLARTRSSRA
ncbi:MAG: hypothetical protein ISR64_06420 [Deltaproteobacteria bacterium]|nr:hypothetical protein [Deltaproteobacteria bacterium]